MCPRTQWTRAGHRKYLCKFLTCWWFVRNPARPAARRADRQRHLFLGPSIEKCLRQRYFRVLSGSFPLSRYAIKNICVRNAKVAPARKSLRRWSTAGLRCNMSSKILPSKLSWRSNDSFAKMVGSGAWIRRGDDARRYKRGQCNDNLARPARRGSPYLYCFGIFEKAPRKNAWPADRYVRIAVKLDDKKISPSLTGEIYVASRRTGSFLV